MTPPKNAAPLMEAPPLELLPIAQPGVSITPFRQSPTPMMLIERALSQGSDIDLDRMERLMEMQERWDKENARKAFLEAMSAFRANAPELHKNCTVDFTSAKGRTSYKHADLEEVSMPIGRVMGPLGLSFRWEPKQIGGRIHVTTILQHAAGHSEQITLEGAPDESGNKNNIQQVGSTITYLQRYGLLAITGMAVRGQDSDGRIAQAPIDTEADEQYIRAARTLQDLQEIYTEVYLRINPTKNKTALDAIAKAKDKRKAELQKGA